MAQKSKWIGGAHAHDPLDDVARVALKGRLELVWHYLPRAAEGPSSDVENVHQLRVATRRAMAAMEIFGSLLPERRSRWIVKRLKQVRRAAGDARDLDVMAARLTKRVEDDPDGERYSALLHRVRYARETAQGPIESVYRKLDRKDYPRRVAGLVKRIRFRDITDEFSRPTYGAAAGKALRPLAEEFFAAGDADFQDYEALHAFRILGKQVRYVMEIFAAAFEPWFKKELYKQVETLQEKLGQVNDHAAAADHLANWQADTVDPELQAPLAALIAEEHIAMESKRDEFLAWWTPQRRNELRAGFARVLAQGEIGGDVGCDETSNDAVDVAT